MSSSSARSEVRRQDSGLALRIAAGAAALIGIQALAYWTTVVAGDSGPAALAPLAVPAAVALFAGWRRGPLALVAVLAALAVIAAAATAWPQAERVIPLASHLAICGGLAWLFGRTLTAGREPLVTQMSRQVHGTLPPAIVAYTRNVTRAWALFFSAAGAISALLFAAASQTVWSAFANLLFFPLVVLMFLVEYGYRTVRHREFRHATLTESIGAFRRVRARPSDAGHP
jgi:uncharacterized membrane protein